MITFPKDSFTLHLDEAGLKKVTELALTTPEGAGLVLIADALSKGLGRIGAVFQEQLMRIVDAAEKAEMTARRARRP